MRLATPWARKADRKRRRTQIMNITMTVHPSWLDHPADLASLLSIAGRLSQARPVNPTHPIPQPREAQPEPAGPEPRPAARNAAGSPTTDAPGGPSTGRALYGWIKDRSDADLVLKKAQGVAKRLGYPWRLTSLSDEAAQQVYHELVTKVLPALV